MGIVAVHAVKGIGYSGNLAGAVARLPCGYCWNPGAGKGFLAIGRGRASQIAFHVRQPGTAAARAHMDTGRTRDQITDTKRAHPGQLRRRFPYIEESLLAYIARQQRKLHTGVNIP